MSTYMIHALHSTGNKAPTGCRKREVDYVAQEALDENDQLETLTKGMVCETCYLRTVEIVSSEILCNCP